MTGVQTCALPILAAGADAVIGYVAYATLDPGDEVVTGWPSFPSYVLDPLKLGLTVSVFIQVSLEKQMRNALDAFESSVLAREEVMECYLMTGDADYLLRVVVPDMPSLERFIVDYLARIPGVSNIRSSFALKQVKYKTALPLPVASARKDARRSRS